MAGIKQENTILNQLFLAKLTPIEFTENQRFQHLALACSLRVCSTMVNQVVQQFTELGYSSIAIVQPFSGYYRIQRTQYCQ